MTNMAEKSAVIRMFHVHKRYGAKQALVDATLDILKTSSCSSADPAGRENPPCSNFSIWPNRFQKDRFWWTA